MTPVQLTVADTSACVDVARVAASLPAFRMPRRLEVTVSSAAPDVHVGMRIWPDGAVDDEPLAIPCALATDFVIRRAETLLGPGQRPDACVEFAAAASVRVDPWVIPQVEGRVALWHGRASAVAFLRIGVGLPYEVSPGDPVSRVEARGGVGYLLGEPLRRRDGRTLGRIDLHAAVSAGASLGIWSAASDVGPVAGHELRVGFTLPSGAFVELGADTPLIWERFHAGLADRDAVQVWPVQPALALGWAGHVE